jgi:NAD(P)-dependent dehydrogenase (short-subunit alcohol dehydrogenase family)
MSVAKRNVFITGCSTGIGRACVLDLTRRGFTVLAGVRKTAHAQELEQACGSAQGVIIDVTDTGSIAAAAEKVRQIVGDAGLVGLINNAGVSVHGPVEHVPLCEWRRQFEVNFFGQIAVTQAMLPLLRQGVATHGMGASRIVMMSSIAGLIAQPIVAPYNASKYALEAVGDSLRMELRRQGIKVCLVEPGAIDTPIWNKTETNGSIFPPDHPARKLYSSTIDGVLKAARRAAAGAIPAEAVAKAVAACMTRKRPRARYVVGWDAFAGAWAKRFLPTAVMDYGVRSALGA